MSDYLSKMGAWSLSATTVRAALYTKSSVSSLANSESTSILPLNCFLSVFFVVVVLGGVHNNEKSNKTVKDKSPSFVLDVADASGGFG